MISSNSSHDDAGDDGDDDDNAGDDGEGETYVDVCASSRQKMQLPGKGKLSE